MNSKLLPRSIAIMAAAAVVALAGCASDGGGQDPAGDRESLTIGLTGELFGWDPAKQIGVGGHAWAQQAVYDSIFVCNEVGEIQPYLAESFTFESPYEKLTFEIRPDMTFSDGTPVDAEAVKTSLEYMMANGVNKVHLSKIDEVSTPSSTTVEITTTSPDPLLTTRLCTELGLVASPDYLASADLNSAPVGSGPYTYDAEASTPGSIYVFNKNDENWNAAAFPFETVTLTVITNPTATLNALKAGQIAGSIADSSIVEAVKSDSDLATLTLQSNVAQLLIMDRNGTMIPALGNADVRRAMNMVFDKVQIAEQLFQGNATPTAQVFRPGSAAYIEGVEDPYGFDVEKARELMAEAGFADGFSVDLPNVSGSPARDAMMPIIIQQLGLLNIEATEVTLTGPNALNELLSGSFPLVYWPLGTAANSYIDVLQYHAPTGVWNTRQATSPVIDEYVAQLPTASAEESAEIQRALNQYLIDEAWYVPMAIISGYFAYNPSLVTIEGSTDPMALGPTLRDFK